MVKGKKVQVTSLSFAPRMWGYLKIRGDLDPGRCPLRGRAPLHICYQTKAIVPNLHPDTPGGATERGPPDAVCQVLPPLRSNKHFPLRLINICTQGRVPGCAGLSSV